MMLQEAGGGMPPESLDAESAHAQRMIAGSPLREFAVPHLIVDNIFPEDLVARINEHWPDNAAFKPEVPGNHILPIYRREYGLFSKPQLQFWKSFNEELWPTVVSATAEAFTGPAYEVFGDLYYKHLALDYPLTLMQADPTFAIHSIPTHFYHCP